MVAETVNAPPERNEMADGTSVGVLVTEDQPSCEDIYMFIEKRIKDVRNTITVHPYYVCKSKFPSTVEDHDAYIISGAHYNVNEGLEWMDKLEEVIREIKSKTYIKLFGICFGHQMIARALGGRVERNPFGGFIWGCHKVNVKPELAEKPYYRSADLEQERFFIMQSHYDQIVKIPTNAQVLGGCDVCPYEVVTYADHILTMQGHPELTTERMLSKITTLEAKGRLNSEEVTVARESMRKEQGDKLMSMIIAFLLT